MVRSLCAHDGDDAVLGEPERVAVDVGLHLRQEVLGLGQGATGEDHDLGVVGMDDGDDGGTQVAVDSA